MGNNELLELYKDCDRVLRFLAEKQGHATYMSYHIALHPDAIKVFGEKDIPQIEKLKAILTRLRIDGYVYREGDAVNAPSNTMYITPTGRDFILRSSYEERELQRANVRNLEKQDRFNRIVGVSVIVSAAFGIIATCLGIGSYVLQSDNIRIYREEIGLIKKGQVQDSVYKNDESGTRRIDTLERKVDSLLKLQKQ